MQLGNGTASDRLTLFTRFGRYQSIHWPLLADVSTIEMGQHGPSPPASLFRRWLSSIQMEDH